MAFKLGEVVNGEPANIIDNVGTMEEPVIWMSKKHKGSNASVEFKNTTSLPDLVGYINLQSGYSPSYTCFYAVGNYGAEIWRSDPNVSSNRGQLDPYLPKEDPSNAEQVLSKHQGDVDRKITTAVKGLYSGTGGSGGRMLDVGQGLHVHGNPALGLSSPNNKVKAIITRQGQVADYEETTYEHTVNYPTGGAQEAQLVGELVDGELGSQESLTTTDGFGTPKLSASGGLEIDLVKDTQYQAQQFAIGCDRVVIGSPKLGIGSANTNVKGQVYIYDKAGANHIATITNPAKLDSSVDESSFGYAVAIADGYIFIGDPDYCDGAVLFSSSSSSVGDKTGAVYIYDLDGRLVYFMDPKKLRNMMITTLNDGPNPDLNMNRTPRDLYPETVTEGGFAAFPFSENNLVAHGTSPLRFGASLAAGGGKLVVGAPSYKTFRYTEDGDTISAQDCTSGAMFLFHYGSNTKGSYPIDDVQQIENTVQEDTPYNHGGTNSFYKYAPALRPSAWTFPSWYYLKGYHDGYQQSDYQTMSLGSRVAISSQYIITGCPNFSDETGVNDQGTALVFDHRLTYLGKIDGSQVVGGINDAYSSSWASNASNFGFGHQVKAQGNTIVIGSWYGAAAVYTHEQYINIHDAIALENGWF